MHFELGFNSAHYVKQFIAGLEKIDKLSFAAKKSRRGAEVATHGATDRWNDGCRRAAFSLRQTDSQNTSL